MIATNTGIRCDERASSMEQRQKKPLRFFIGRLLAEKTVVSMGKSLKHGGCAFQTLKRNCEKVGELNMTKSNYKKKVVDSFQIWIPQRISPQDHCGSHFAREVPNRNGCTMAEVHHDLTPGRSSGWFMDQWTCKRKAIRDHQASQKRRKTHGIQIVTLW